MTTVSQTYGSGGPYATVKSFIVGLECELEGVKPVGKSIGNFQGIADNSLKVHGIEYITVVPCDRQKMVADFKQLHKALQFYPGEDPFSFRTSTHVHVNASSMEEEHVRNMILLYALFEQFFFAMVKPARRDNIHCVPLTETHLVGQYNKKLDQLIQCWSKYTALNLKRLTDLGTVEFRHMHGTGDAEELETWLAVLENLWMLAQRVSINEKSLCDQIVIGDWFHFIFNPAPRVLALKPSLFDIIKNSLIDVKFSTL